MREGELYGDDSIEFFIFGDGKSELEPEGEGVVVKVSLVLPEQLAILMVRPLEIMVLVTIVIETSGVC